jgi:hypothetical protein
MSRQLSPLLAALLGLLTIASPSAARADQTVTCRSLNYQHTSCSLREHGYVRLERQTSKNACVKGRTWDYNYREIWVDDGCSGVFVVESRSHSGSDGDAAKAAAAIGAIAILGAAVAANKDSHRYEDEYGRPGNSSFVPRWLVGNFRGYNEQRRAEVSMNISNDGRVRASVDNFQLTGYINDRRLYVGDAVFDIERTGDGFQTTQVGEWRNRTQYTRR